MQASRYCGPEILTLGKDRKIARGSTGRTVGMFTRMTWLATAAGVGVGEALAVAESLLPVAAAELEALGDGVEAPGGIIESLDAAV